ncbi:MULTISPECIES: ATP-binding protein [unclassified Nostoc]|uniref:ATP-binding protein n=1 Tax=unclassified Nostoc TaxID=2593658 RepID=UPI0025AA7200|nr:MULTISPECIES: ATP-binding protein [unclassified Nostoc]MDM9582034.1 ATP-binding protein [Nostoc sp. GT001]MDZ7949440.1 ATP-binding protein [Nostoc sp. EfeVER01]MDZ7993769.1 ATP-binding protein [Nostoc sp. EspVER01]MDZ8029560.1 ATP-binding protein [Nostoc sp. DedSLP04]
MEPLTVPGTLDSLKAIAEYVMAAAMVAGLNKKTSYRLRLAVDEIATNIINYGYQAANRQGILILKADLDDRSLTITIKDTGVPFNPTQKLTPNDLNKSLQQRQIGGLGVYLALKSVDRFIYQQDGNQNCNILIVNRDDGLGIS